MFIMLGKEDMIYIAVEPKHAYEKNKRKKHENIALFSINSKVQ